MSNTLASRDIPQKPGRFMREFVCAENGDLGKISRQDTDVFVYPGQFGNFCRE